MEKQRVKGLVFLPGLLPRNEVPGTAQFTGIGGSF